MTCFKSPSCRSELFTVYTVRVNGVQCALNSNVFLYILFYVQQKKERSTYRMTWGWVNDERVYIFRWTIHLKFKIAVLYYSFASVWIWFESVSELTVLSGSEGGGGLRSTACRCTCCQLKCVRPVLLKTTDCPRLTVRIIHWLSEGTCQNKRDGCMWHREEKITKI